VRPDAAHAYVLTFIRENGKNPGEAMERRKAEGFTVGECADRWLLLLEADPRCAPATLKGHRTHAKNWIKPALATGEGPTFGEMPIAALDVPMLRSWLRRLRAQGKDPRSTLHAVSSFHTLYGVAMAEGWVDAPANLLRHDGVLAEMPEVDDDEPVRLPLEWAQKVLDCPVVPLERRARYAVAFKGGERTARSPASASIGSTGTALRRA